MCKSFALIARRRLAARRASAFVLVLSCMMAVCLAEERTSPSQVPPAGKLVLVRSYDKDIPSKDTVVYGLAVSSDGQRVLVGGDMAKPVLTYWNIETGATELKFDTVTKHNAPIFPAI